MLMPATALVLPIFLELNALHLLGSVLAVILPFAFFPFGVYLAYLYYATTLPAGLLDAARVDGCGEWQAFVRVALPLAKPVVALVFFFSFVADWNNFFLPYVVLPDSAQYPVEVGLNDLLLWASRPMLALATLIAATPVVVVSSSHSAPSCAGSSAAQCPAEHSRGAGAGTRTGARGE